MGIQAPPLELLFFFIFGQTRNEILKVMISSLTYHWGETLIDHLKDLIGLVFAVFGQVHSCDIGMDAQPFPSLQDQIRGRERGNLKVALHVSPTFETTPKEDGVPALRRNRPGGDHLTDPSTGCSCQCYC